jgi:dolichol-phosphate mannosyltransferase
VRISVVTPVFDETDSVRELCAGVVDLLGEDLHEILIVLSPNSSPASFDACLSQSECYPGLVKVVLQQGGRGLGVAYREGISYARGSHTICMDSDGEMELETVSRLRDLFQTDSTLVLAVAARWLPGGGFDGYSWSKQVLNWLFQRFFGLLFWTDTHDLTYGFKMYRTDMAQRMPFTGSRHEFACEGTLLPIRLGFKVAETPSRWTKRKAGVSQNPFRDNFRYVRMALRLRFQPQALLTEPFKADPVLLESTPTTHPTS